MAGKSGKKHQVTGKDLRPPPKGTRVGWSPTPTPTPQPHGAAVLWPEARKGLGPGTQLGVLTVGILAEMGEGCQAWRKRGLPWRGAETSWRAQDSSQAWGPSGRFQPGPGGGDRRAASPPPQGLWGAQGAGPQAPQGRWPFPGRAP